MQILDTVDNLCSCRTLDELSKAKPALVRMPLSIPTADVPLSPRRKKVINTVRDCSFEQCFDLSRCPLKNPFKVGDIIMHHHRSLIVIERSELLYMIQYIQPCFEFQVFFYPLEPSRLSGVPPTLVAALSSALRSSPHITEDPRKACLFVYVLSSRETPSPDNGHRQQVPDNWSLRIGQRFRRDCN